MKRSVILKDMIEGAKKDLKDIQDVNNDSSDYLKDKIDSSADLSLKSENVSDFRISPLSLGSKSFRERYGIKYAYLTGSMVRGIASKEMVVKIGKAGMMGFVGTGGQSLVEIEQEILFIQKELSTEQVYGFNMLHNPNNQVFEAKLVDLYLKYGVSKVEASAYMLITPSLIRFRAKGLSRNSSGEIQIKNKIIAKISRPEIAEMFLSPASDQIISKLLSDNLITQEEAGLIKEVPVADDICVEADSGGHTDGGVAYALMPVMLKLRDDMMSKYQYPNKIHVGAAGGIGAPEAAAAAFILGADFITTGSINQCTVEAGTSDSAKDLLQEMNVQDTDYAPAGDMFELGAKVQVLKKSLFFPARANKLYTLYNQYNSLDEIDEKTKTQIQEKYFKRSFSSIYEDCVQYFNSLGTNEIERAEKNPKVKMALVFRWYFSYSTQLALKGNIENKVDYQIHCGPALGAFNQWVKGTPLENWRNRHVDEIALKLLTETAYILNIKFGQLRDS